MYCVLLEHSSIEWFSIQGQWFLQKQHSMGPSYLGLLKCFFPRIITMLSSTDRSRRSVSYAKVQYTWAHYFQTKAKLQKMWKFVSSFCVFFFVIIVILFPEHWIWVCHNTFFKQRAWNRNKMFLSCPESVGHVVFSTYATSYWKPFCPILSRRECKGYDIINWIKMNSERCGG